MGGGRSGNHRASAGGVAEWLAMQVAISRAVSAAMGKCELTHLERVPLDVVRARQQHAAYQECLRQHGCRVLSLPAEDALPDSVFVEDAAVVLEELAVMARPGAKSRRAETGSVASALERYRPLTSIRAPGTLDGGDVLALGKTVFVGQSRRTNAAGIEQLTKLLRPYGYEVKTAPVERCLHLKSAATRVAKDALLVNPAWVETSALAGFELIAVHPDEPGAANALPVGKAVVVPAAYPRTADILRQRGLAVETLDVSEIAKAEGGLTCCSIIFQE